MKQLNSKDNTINIREKKNRSMIQLNSKDNTINIIN